MNQKEKLFFDKLKDIFIGAKIEGESGFINLMRIKSAYFDVIFKELMKEIEEKTEDFPDFKEEMFDKLYSFFKAYFSESGSIYFSYTPLKSKIYERVYTNQKDVALFWKTHMLYYVKTDKLWNNLTVDFDVEGIKYKIHFDVSKLEHKKANEKREVIYELKEIKDKEITFNVLYSERGRKTKTEEILKTFKKKNIWVDEEKLTKIFRIFEKQNEVDFFINKNAEAFLKEQFDLWLKNYLFDDESDFSEKRLKELKALKEIAYKVIDFVAQFEDELVKIWNKPKFVLNSNYVITLDRIAKKKDGIKVIEKIITHEGFSEQVNEWKELGILKDFDKKKLFTTTLNGKEISKEYQFLPIDTKYFDEEIKLEILSLFDNLDKELDGWLIHSENYQALKTILPKFQEKVQTIYIDPPFNTGNDFIFVDKFQDATWLTMMENRLNLARDFLKNNGTLYLHLDHIAEHFGKLLLDNIFGNENFQAKITWNTGENISGFKSQALNWIRQADFIHFYSKSNNFKFNKIYEPLNKEDKIGWLDFIGNKDKLYVEIWSNGKLIKKEFKGEVKAKGTIWNDIYSFQYSKLGITESLSFTSNQKPENLLRRIIQSASDSKDLVMDFFAGSGTTCAVAHKLNRKWIGIEMGDFFREIYLDIEKIEKSRLKMIKKSAIIEILNETEKEITAVIKKIGLLGRMKIVLKGDKEFEVINSKQKRHPHLSNDISWQGGGFFKYFDLEQYEQTLKKAVYKPSHPFVVFSDKTIYQQYVFLKDLKLLEAMKLDYENNKIKIDFDKIYPNIDLAETISCITGKAIKKIEKDAVILEDGEKIKFDEVDFNLIKPLIWW